MTFMEMFERLGPSVEFVFESKAARERYILDLIWGKYNLLSEKLKVALKKCKTGRKKRGTKQGDATNK